MPRIRCYFLEPTEFQSISLRRYGGTCPVNGYHDAKTCIEREPTEKDEQGHITNELKPVSSDDPRWPVACTCGYQFKDEDNRQRFAETLFRRTDTGEEMTMRDASAGAMWYAPWLQWYCTSQDEDGHILMVKTPGGDWIVDSQATNCTLPDDTKQERHHCWIRHGNVPIITVDKSGVTCGAGAGSIQCGSYHGFLRNGYLED